MSRSLCQFWNEKLIPLQILYPSSGSRKKTPRHFLAQTIYTLLKRSLLKWNFLRRLSVQDKICQIPICQFWNDKSIPLQILYPSLVSWKKTPLYYFSSNNIYFAQKEPTKVKIFETLSAQVKTCQIPIYEFWKNKSIPLQILYPSLVSWKKTPLYYFSSNNIYFAQKEPTKVKIFETLSAQVKTCQIPIYEFWKNKSTPLQILYPSSVSWKKTHLHVLAQTIYTLLKRSPLKWNFLRLSSGQVKICQIFYVNFETTSQFLSKFCIPLQFHER